MSGHTPGPWTVEKLPLGNDGEVEPAFRVSGDSTLFLTVSPCSDGFVPGQNRANAHLIAAAPDLLAACESVVINLDRLCEVWGSEGVTERVRTSLRAAVAKAKEANP